jgi:diguanylate cyclase (GGDEF)-like protein/PAS domain S-box-containing protein
VPTSRKKATSREELESELEKLRHRQALLDATEQVADIGHCEWDYEHDRLISCSPGYARIFNMSLAEVLDSQSSWEKVLDQIHPEDRELFTNSYRSQQQTGSHEIEYRIIRNDGQLRHVREAGILHLDEKGKAGEAFGLIQDITERKVYEQNLENREALAQQAETITDIGHFIFDLVNSGYDYISPGFARIHGVSVDKYMNMVNSREDDMRDVHADDYAHLAEVYHRQRVQGIDVNVEYRIRRADGELRWIGEQCTTLRNDGGMLSKSIGVVQDITQQKNTERNLREARDFLEATVKDRTQELADTIIRLEEEIDEREKVTSELNFLANHDALTGLPSLRLCKDRLDRSLAEARRNRQKSAVMFLDLDGFKEINDTYGHEFGDLVLKVTADRIKAEIRETDTVARIGGDEFVIILSRVPELEIVERIASSLIRQISQAIRIVKYEVSVSASIGIALYPDHGSTSEDLIRVADKAMYLVKNSGKNNFQFYQRSN